MGNKRKDFTDSQIMDALDACNFSIPKASKMLGVQNATLYKWVNASPNLKGYRNLKLGMDALKAREILNTILDNHSTDPDRIKDIISVCKILLDKAEADKQDLTTTNTHQIDKDLNDKISKLLGE